MVSSTVGSSTSTGWKRRSRAASFSMCLRYSSSVVAPMQCSSPRASIGLSMLPASIAPSAVPAPTTVCSSSMNRMISPSDGCDLLQHGLEALLELAAVLGAGDQRAQVERDDALVLQALGHVAADDALGQALDDGGLADARLADEHRVVLGAAREHLDDAADLVVAADDRVELALARRARSGRGRTSPAPGTWLSGFWLVTRWLPRTSCSACRSRSPGRGPKSLKTAGARAVAEHGEQQVLDARRTRP